MGLTQLEIPTTPEKTAAQPGGQSDGRRRRMSQRNLTGSFLAGVLVFCASPVWMLWVPGTGKLQDHLYRNLIYDRVARQVTRGAVSQREIVERLAEYVQIHMWAPAGSVPYDGKPLDYLIEGIGWCDYLAKTYVVLLATQGIAARYAMLMERADLSPHTITEVWYPEDAGRPTWGAVDPLFGLVFRANRSSQARTVPVTLEELSADPRLIKLQPELEGLRRDLPERAEEIQQVYAAVIPLPIPPRRSHAGTKRVSVFDRLLLNYAHAGGDRFVAWYQDQYLSFRGEQASGPQARGTLWTARHYHLAGRTSRARVGYAAAQHSENPRVKTDAFFWSGVLEWEQGNTAKALQQFRALLAEDPSSRWAPLAWYYMGRCEEDAGHPGEAQRWYAQAGSADFPAAWHRTVRLRPAVSVDPASGS